MSKYTVTPDQIAVQVVETHYTVAEAASLLRVSDDYIRERVNAGVIKAVEFGSGRSKFRIPASALQDWVDSLPTLSA